MYAQLGDIVFKGLLAFSSFEHSKEENIVEHPLIDGKPILQTVGGALDKIKLDVMYHRAFCTPETELRKLDTARANGDVLQFVTGNGTVLGSYVVKSTSQSNQHVAPDGSIIECRVSVDLLEHVEADQLGAAVSAAITAGFANAQNNPAQASIPAATAAQSASQASQASALVVATSTGAAGVNSALAKVAQFPAQAGYQMAVINGHASKMKASIQALQAIIANPGSVQDATTSLSAMLPSLLSTVNNVASLSGAGNLAGVQAANVTLQAQAEDVKNKSNLLSILKARR